MTDARGLVRNGLPWDLAERVLRDVDQPVVVADEDGRVRLWNDAVAALSGWRPEEADGRPVEELATPAVEGLSSWAAVRERLRADGRVSGWWLLHSRSGRPVRVRGVVTSSAGDCGGHGFVAVLRASEPAGARTSQVPRQPGVREPRDVDERQQALRALRRSEGRYRAIVHAAHEGIWAVGPAGETISANRKLAEILGVTLEEVYAGVVPDALHRVYRTVQPQVRRGDPREVREHEITFTRASDDERRTLSVSASPLPFDDGSAGGTLLMVSDVTDVRRGEEALRWQALHDPLTGVHNRASFHAALDGALGRLASGAAASVAVLYVDVDNLKLVNDTHGHDVGDRLLCELAARLRTAAGPAATVARLGGDEFAVLAEGLGEEQAVALAGRFTRSLATPAVQVPEPVVARASIGVAVSPPAAARTLLTSADRAMYRAKKTPGLEVSVHDPGSERSDRELAVVTSVRDALDRRDVGLHYQPIVDLRTGATVAVEALIRHTDARLGPVPADQVAAVAERYGWTPELDRIVLTRACEDLVTLGRGGPGPAWYVSVNVSPSTPGDRLEELAADALGASGLPPGRLMLEVTENTVMDDPDNAIRWLRALRRRGVRLALDDFGTGYSSLRRLHRLPLDGLKIDRSFVQDAAADPGAREITRSIALLARAFGLQTVAEGVEDEEQAEAVRALGCDLAQGYLWSPAVPLSELL